MSIFDPNESPAKLALDNAELVERIPELQRGVAAANHDDSGGLVLVLPRHPLLTAFMQELDQVEYESTSDLKLARRHLRVAKREYKDRVAQRVMVNLTGWRFEDHVSLSAILIQRAAALHWRKIIAGLECAERVKKHNKWAAAYAGLIRL